MIKIYLTVTAIFMIIITIAAGIIKPGINKSVQFTKSDFQITTTELAQDKTATHEPPVQNKIVNTELTDTKVIEKTIETKAPQAKPKTQIIENKSNTLTKTKEITTQSPKTQTKTQTVKTTPTKTEQKTITQNQTPTQTQTKTVETAQLPQSVKNIITGSQTQKNTESTVKPKEPQKVVLPNIQPTQTPEQIIKEADKEDRPLTEQEEIIVWNIWRSNLQNQIMRDTKISAPLGTTFKFSFTVDKRGRISNLNTWASPSAYNTVAVNYLKPLIQSYQGQPILNFPSRTKRVITNVTGGFVISTEDKFSTPGDFSDIEKIKTYK